jgi:hypothetical protein
MTMMGVQWASYCRALGRSTPVLPCHNGYQFLKQPAGLQQVSHFVLALLSLCAELEFFFALTL